MAEATFDTATPVTTDGKSEAKTRFNAALDEAKAGAAALRADASERSKAKSADLKAKARVKQDEYSAKAGDIAVQGKAKASEGLNALGRMASDNAASLDENLGPKYGDYARTASRKLHETAATLDTKSIDELSSDTREFVRANPGLSLGVAAIAGYALSRIFRG